MTATTFPSARYRTEGYALSDTSKTAVLTCGPGVFLDLAGGRITVDDGTPGSVSIFWYDASSTTEFPILYEAEVPGAGYLKLLFDPLHMDPSDELRVQGEANMHVVVTMLEQGRNVGPR